MSSLEETRHTITLSFGVQNDCIKTAAKFGGVAHQDFFSIQRIFAEDESIQITRIAEAIEAIEEAVETAIPKSKKLLKAAWSKSKKRLQTAWPRSQC